MFDISKGFVGEVVDVNDPEKSGRVKIRIYGLHDRKESMPDEKLPWAIVIAPVTMAQIGRIGASPLGLVRGSRVMGMFADKDHQIPMINGSLGKAGEIIDGMFMNNVPVLDKDKGSIAPQTSNTENSPYGTLGGTATPRLSITDINNTSANTDVIWHSSPIGAGASAKTEIPKQIKSGSKKTIAGAPKDEKDVLKAVSNVDPEFNSAVFKNLVKNLISITESMNSNTQSATKNILSDALLIGITNLINVFGFESIINKINFCLKNTNNLVLEQSILDALSVALTKIYANPTLVLTVPDTNLYNSSINTQPSPIVNLPLFGSLQQYYTIDTDPYPGYIQWLNLDNTFSYTLRKDIPNYSSGEQHSTFDAGKYFSDTLTPYIINNILTTNILYETLKNTNSLLKASLNQNNLGQGINSNNIINFIEKLLSSTLTKSIKSILKNHLPQSVLNVNSMNETINKFSKTQVDLTNMVKLAKSGLSITDIQKDVAMLDSLKNTVIKNVINPSTGNKLN